MAMWNPWRGCHRVSEGCKFCYIHKGDLKRGMDTNEIVRLPGLNAPIEKNSRGEYRMKGGQTVYLCFSSDFLLPEADGWRAACWDAIRARPDLQFLFLTKRIERFSTCVPADWGAGWDQLTVGVSVENQARADERLPLLSALPIRHKNIILQPMLEAIELQKYLDGIELVVLGGEADRDARPLDYAWVQGVRRQCRAANVPFEFRQCGTNFIRDGQHYRLNPHKLCAAAREIEAEEAAAGKI